MTPPRRQGVAERQAGDERRDEAVAVEPECAGIGGQGKCQHAGSGEVLRHPAPPARDPNRPAARGAEADTDGQADREVDEAAALVHATLDAPGDRRARDREHHDRGRYAVVEPALDVEDPPDPFRHGGVGHHRGAQRRVRRRQRGADHQRQPEAQVAEEPRRQQRARRDGQRKPDRQQPGVKPGVGAEVPEPDPGGVDEQHPDEGHLGEQLDGLVRDVRVDDVHHLREQQPDGDEDDGRAQVRAAEPRREQAPAEDEQHDQRDGRVIHGLPLLANVSRTVASPGVPPRRDRGGTPGPAGGRPAPAIRRA
nr:hypothetical protein GCM10020092_065700 [Actinoplanes digitatis]